MGTIDQMRRHRDACRRAGRSAAFSRPERERFAVLADELSRAIEMREDEQLARAATGTQIVRIVARARARRTRILEAAE